MRQPGRVSFEDVLSTFFRHKDRVLAVLLLAVAGTAAWLAFQPPMYVAETRVLVRIGREKMAGVESLARDNYNVLFQERGQDIHNGIEILKDSALAHAVHARLQPMMQPSPPPQGGLRLVQYWIKQAFDKVKAWVERPLYWFGFRAEVPPEEKAVQALRQSLAIEAIEDSDVIRLSFSWPDPQFAAIALNTYAEEFLAKYIQVHVNAQSEDFYRDQVKVNEDKLTQAEAALAEFRTRNGITNLPLQKELLLREAQDVEARLSEASMRLQEFRAMRDAVAGALASGSAWIQTPEYRQQPVADLSSLDKQYFELVARRSQLQAYMGEANPELQQMAPRMEQLRQSKGRSLTAVLTNKVNLIAQERANLEAQAREKRARLSALDQHTAQLGELERARTTAETNYMSYKKKGEELRVSDLLSSEKVSGVRVVSEATPPPAPSGPRRGLILGIAALVGLFLGIGFSAIAEYFNRTFRHERDVEDVLGARVLMVLPRLREAEA